jgi:hypothetical protein
VLQESLRENTRMQRLLLHDSPIGLSGARNLLRATQTGR